jgi:hypothetical protein
MIAAIQTKIDIDIDISIDIYVDVDVDVDIDVDVAVDVDFDVGVDIERHTVWDFVELRQECMTSFEDLPRRLDFLMWRIERSIYKVRIVLSMCMA